MLDLTAGATDQQPVFDVLGRSSARRERELGLGDGLRLVQWHNHGGRMDYRRPGHHTLSVYLQGGHATHLVETPRETGRPGCHCVLPAEHESRWNVAGPLRFVHLYLSDGAWADRVVRLLDAEPRAITLEQRIFGEDAVLAAWAQDVAARDWQAPDERLRIDALSQAALDHLVLQAARPRQRERAERAERAAAGGLSGAARRRVLACVDAHLDGGELSLPRLAAEAHLSEFHFARMFRASMGCSVHDWVAARRLERARTLLRDTRLPLADIAAACGYAGASHLSQRFKAGVGVTPGGYRGALGAR
ncbi:helix-turn-helix transcriptional regulator [Roseateles saccharophilus]|uniref:AraC family transcriptional regulator n=1 Tax=Roseateles saccharophilus TaxID=304 RepID=A0A4V2VS49_ROSSA|nr:helix-turn-helix transcriptional regulator [Roseateles saccharophilus]MDG0831590.1 AraC family transcriptional regulator [Roseateles saccharophilus]TCV01000.1 AraC family transcriptional regulator [Roseateles saccharophilus]